MKQYLLFLLIPIFSIGQNKVDTTKFMKLEEGTIIVVKSMSNIPSKTISYGESLDFACADDIFINNKLIFKKNSNIKAKVEKIDNAKILGKEGVLEIKFNSITAIDGQEILIEAVYGKLKGTNNTGTAVNLSIFLSPLFLFIKGKEAEIPIGSQMEVYTTRESFIRTQ
jgi:hypothetical protein